MEKKIPPTFPRLVSLLTHPMRPVEYPECTFLPPRVKRQKYSRRNAVHLALFGSFFRSSIVENENATEKGMSKRKIVENIFTSTEPRASSCRLCRVGVAIASLSRRALSVHVSVVEATESFMLSVRCLSLCCFYAYLINLVSPMLWIVFALASLSLPRCIPKLNARIGVCECYRVCMVRSHRDRCAGGSEPQSGLMM
jgi:hypothetical protein